MFRYARPAAAAYRNNIAERIGQVTRMQFEQNSVIPSRRPRRRSAESGAWYARLAAALVSDRARFVAFAFFVVAVALMGGGSRSDIQSLVVLRPLAVLFAAYALFCTTSVQIREVKAPLSIVAALMLLALLQLVPLPTDVWTSLPHREVVAEISANLGMEDLARPLSLDPNRTWNTFFALFVPLSAILLTAIQAPDYRRLILPMIFAVGLASAALGLLQAIGGGHPQFYEVAHRGYPTGLFANKNHQSILLLWLMLAGSWFVTTADPRRHSAKAILGGVLAMILVLFPLLILTGSRAGLLLSPLALLLSGWLLFAAPETKNILRRAGRRAKIIAGAAIMAIVAQLLFVLGVLATSNRQTALSRLFEREPVEELRWSYMQAFFDMSEAYLPFGSGLGSFESVFNAFEPAGMLTSRYMNQVHNDLIQLAIEGGFPAMAILLTALLWLGNSCWRTWRSSQHEKRIAAVFYGGSVLLWLAASVVDYPLRTPLAAMLVAILTAQLAMLSTGTRSRSGLPTKQAPPAEEF